jgi:exopolysaccharide biosynthesis polyprenyl glycosylphosphotransferase
MRGEVSSHVAWRRGFQASRLRRPRSGGPEAVGERSAPTAIEIRDRRFRRALLSADVLAAFVVAGSLQLTFGDSGPGTAGLTLAVLVPFVNTASSLYRRDELVLSKTTLDEAPALFQAATLAAVAAFLLESTLVSTPLGAQVMAFTLLALTVSTMLLRLTARGAVNHFSPSERCLVIGGSDAEQRFARLLRTGARVKADLAGRLAFEPGGANGGATAFTSVSDLRRAVHTLGVHRVVVAADTAAPEAVHEAIHSAKALGVKVSLMPRMFEVVGSSVAFDHLGGLTLLGVRRFGLSRRARVVKRTFDLLGSVLLVVALAPLFAVIAGAIRLESSGPVLFCQTRVGRAGRHFRMLKFRSMVPDAEELKPDLAVLNEADGLFKIDGDPRITLVGRVLRRTLLDELPQLLNVLRGEMSLVGPRPLVLDEDEQIRGWHRRRLDLMPGMTGPWQVAGAARIPLRDMIAIDYLYVANWSLWGDIKILLRTVPLVLLRRGQ